MPVFTATEARSKLYRLIDEVTSSHEPIIITSKNARAKGAEEKVAQAKDWLTERLAEGPVESKVLKAEAQAMGISDRAFRRGIGALRAVSELSGFQGKWRYRLPESDATGVSEIVNDSARD